MNNYIKNITSTNEGLLSSYLKISWVIIPILSIQLINHYFKINVLANLQVAITAYILTGLILLQFLRKNNFIKNNFYNIQAVFLILLIIIEFIWYSNTQEIRQLISLILAITITGVALIKPKISIVFFSTTIVLLIVINLINDSSLMTNLHYFIISGVFIIAFNFWRENLTSLLELSQSSFKNIFSDSQSLIFVINKKNNDIIELNTKAQDYIDSEDLSSKNIKYIFNDEKDITLLIEKLNLLNEDITSLQFETNFDSDDSHYIPKEFNIKSSTFFNTDVFIIQVKLINERKENEKELIETKDNIIKIIDNINSFIYNIVYYDKRDIQLRFVSSGAAEILDIEIDEVILKIKSNRIKFLIHPDDLSYVQQKIKKASSTLEVEKLEYRLIINDKIKWVKETIFPKKENNAVVHFGIVTEITEQKNNELLLISSEKKHRQLFEESLAGIYKTTEDGSIIDANITFAKMLGFDNVEELKLKNINDFYFESEDRLSYINDLKINKSISNHIAVLKTINNNQIITSNNAFIYEENNIICITGTLIDVTELHQTTQNLKANEIKLKESQKSFKSIVENSPAALLIFDSRNKLVFSNKKAELLSENYLNTTSNEFEKIFKKEHKYIIEKLFIEAENPIQSYTQLVLENSNSIENYSLQVVKVNYNNEEANLLIFRNVTIEHEFNKQKLRAELAEETNISLEKEIVQHKITQKLLIENRNFTESLFDSSLDMIIASDTDNIITLVNKAATTKFGYSKEELEGKNLSLIVESNDIQYDVRQEIMDNNKFVGEVHNITKEGEKFKAFLSATRIENEKGELTGFMGISRDLSELTEIQNIITTQSSLIDSLFQNESDVFIWSLNKNLDLVSFNNRIIYFFESTGIQLKSGIKFFDQIKASIDTDNLDESLGHFNNVLHGEKSNFVLTILNKKGEKKWLNIHLTPILLPDGNIQEIMCLGTDITEQINKNIIIEKSEKSVKAVLNAIPDLMLNISKNGTILNYTTHTEHQREILTKFIPKDGLFIGKNVADIFKEEESFSKKAIELLNKAIDEEKVISHHFSHIFGDKELYFENRYSKINENEAIVVVREKTIEIENENSLKQSLSEKEILLKEVHHRVKNNLQIINSILNLQSSYIEDEKTLEIISESQNRIRSMSFIHESLYQTSNFSSINFKEYIENLLSNLIYSYQIGTKIKIIKEIENIDLSLDQAIPCGLILNELITNALKYAYGLNEEGNVYISIKKVNTKIEIIVQDFGAGLPDNFDIETADSLGLSLVHTLTEQIDGELMIKSDGGTKILIIFEML